MGGFWGLPGGSWVNRRLDYPPLHCNVFPLQNMSPPCVPPMAAEDPLQPPILRALFYRPEPDEDDDDEQGWDGDPPETPPADGDPPKTVEPLNTEEPASDEDHPRNAKRVSATVGGDLGSGFGGWVRWEPPTRTVGTPKGRNPPQHHQEAEP